MKREIARVWLPLSVAVVLVAGCASRATLQPVSSTTAHTQVVQTGQPPTDFIFFPVPYQYLSGIAATPNGKFAFIGQNSSGIFVAWIGMDGHFVSYRVREASRIIIGNDGAAWFAETTYIGRMTSAGVYTEFPVTDCEPEYLAVGPDGRIWFSGIAAGNQDHLDAIDATGKITTYLSKFYLFGLTTGPDHNIWVGGRQNIYRIDRNRRVSTFAIPPPPGNNDAFVDDMKVGADGALWFSLFNQGSSYEPGYIGRMTTTGLFTFFPLGRYAQAYGLTAEPHDMAFGLTKKLTPAGLGFITMAGRFRHESLPAGEYAAAMAHGTDGNLWFAEGNNATSSIGIFIRFIISVSPSSATIAVGQQQTLSVTENGNGNVWSAKSSDPSIATVTGPSGGKFTVTGVAAGSCTITISDQRQNSFNVQVTVHQ